MPHSLSGKMPVILPLVLPLVSFGLLVLYAVAAWHRDPDQHGDVLAIASLYMLVTLPSCCAIAFSRSDKAAVIMFSSAVILLLLLLFIVPMMLN
jgi:hypothetical protein